MEQKPRVARWFWWLSAILLVSCCAGSAVLLWFAGRKFDSPFAARELDETASQYRRAGLPFLASDITPKPPIRDNENAAPLLRDAFQAFHYSQFNKERVQIVELVRGGQLNEASSRLKPYDAALDLAATAAQRPRIDWHRDWDLGVMVLFPEFAQMKGLVHGLCARAHLRAQQKDTEGAFRDLSAAFKIAGLAGQDPSLIPSLVQIACETIALDAVTRVADAVKKDPRALARLIEVTSPAKHRPSLPEALRGEIFLGLATIRNLPLLKGKNETDRSKLQRDGLPTAMVQRAYMARFMQFWVRGAAVIKEHGKDPIELSLRLDRLQQETMRGYPLSQVLNAKLLPLLAESGAAFVKLEANWAATRALLWVLTEEAKGRKPAAIDAAFIDPFTSQPLRLRRQGNSVRVYSLGPDKRDDHGLDRSELPERDRDVKTWDIAAANPPIKRTASKQQKKK
jgi:hypothetical protein